MRFFGRMVCLVTSFVLPSIAMAVYLPPPKKESTAGFGDIAQSLMAPVMAASNFLGVAAIIIGIGFVFASFFKYKQHRENHLAVPFSTVVILFIMGVILICLPLAYKLTGTGIPLRFR